MKKKKFLEKGRKMPFIGIVAKENDSNFIKKAIIRNSKLDEFKIININKKSIENVKNIKFDILVVNDNIEILLKNSKYLEKIINNAYYVIVNSDIKNNLFLLKNFGTNIITYGFNEKATVTISSIKEENTMVCIQRSIIGFDKSIVEEQEVNIKIEKNNVKKLYNVLVIFIILRIYGKILKKI
jgi:hypothetical protein